MRFRSATEPGIQLLPATLWEIHDQEGVAGLLAGWLPRLLWNGLIVGAVLGLCRPFGTLLAWSMNIGLGTQRAWKHCGRLQYEDARAVFLVDVLDRFESIVQPMAAQN